MLDFAEINLGIKSGIGANIQYFEIIDSTNSYLKNNAAYFPEGTVIWAGKQTSGKGRNGSIWNSPENSGLYFSILTRPKIAVEQAQLITLMTALSLKRAVEDTADEMKRQPAVIDIKWPNDLLWKGKKFAGILVEALHTANNLDIIVGIGLNLLMSEKDFPPDLKGKACSLRQIFGGDWTSNRNHILKKILLNFADDYRKFNPLQIVEEYRMNSNIWGKRCRFITVREEIHGICKDIADNGALIITTASGDRKFIAGSLFIDW